MDPDILPQSRESTPAEELDEIARSGSGRRRRGLRIWRKLVIHPMMAAHSCLLEQL